DDLAVCGQSRELQRQVDGIAQHIASILRERAALQADAHPELARRAAARPGGPVPPLAPPAGAPPVSTYACMRVAAAVAASAVAKSAMMASPWRRSTRPPESSAACASASTQRSRAAIGSTCGLSLALTRANSTAARRPGVPRM